MRVLRTLTLAASGMTAAGALAACLGTSQTALPVAPLQPPNGSPSQSLAKEGLFPNGQDGKVFGTLGNNGQVVLIDFKSGEVLDAISLNEPFGSCVQGETVWISVGGDFALRRYDGAGKLLTVLSEPGWIPHGCAVHDGALAVANLSTISGGRGNVTIFAGAKGSGKTYAVPGMTHVFYVCYDPAGDLFAAGIHGNSIDSGYRLAELEHGPSRFTALTLIGGRISYPGGMQYAHDMLVLTDMYTFSAIYRARVVGSTATVIGSTPIKGGPLNAWYIYDERVLVSTWNSTDVSVYRYPAGGLP